MIWPWIDHPASAHRKGCGRGVAALPVIQNLFYSGNFLWKSNWNTSYSFSILFVLSRRKFASLRENSLHRVFDFENFMNNLMQSVLVPILYKT